ncbi:MAG: hypothetical protein WCS44_06095, partial [Bacillota bacterium]
KANGLLLGAYLDYINKSLPQKVMLAVNTLGFAELSGLQTFLSELYTVKLDLTTREIALYVEKALRTSNIENTPGKMSGYVLADILERSVN